MWMRGGGEAKADVTETANDTTINMAPLFKTLTIERKNIKHSDWTIVAEYTKPQKELRAESRSAGADWQQ
jgi:hypothetical protein